MCSSCMCHVRTVEMSPVCMAGRTIMSLCVFRLTEVTASARLDGSKWALQWISSWTTWETCLVGGWWVLRYSFYHSCFVYFCVCMICTVVLVYQFLGVNCLPYGANIISQLPVYLYIRPRPSICVIWKIVVTCPGIILCFECYCSCVQRLLISYDNLWPYTIFYGC